MNYTLLKTEIDTDPTGIGFKDGQGNWKPYQDIADLFNAKTIGSTGKIPGNDALKWAAKNDVLGKLQDDAAGVTTSRSAAIAALKIAESPGTLVLDTSDSDIKAMISALVATNVLTVSQKIDLMQHYKISRAEQLGFGVVTVRDIERAV